MAKKPLKCEYCESTNPCRCLEIPELPTHKICFICKLNEGLLPPNVANMLHICGTCKDLKKDVF